MAQLIINVLIIATFLLIIKGSEGKIFVNFEPPVPKVNYSLCIFLNVSDLQNETIINEINLQFKPPTYNETTILTYVNGSFALNDKVIDKYFTKRVIKNNTTATSFCLDKVLKEDLAYPFQWTCDFEEISFRLHDPSGDQPPNINAIFFEPAIPKFGDSICYSLNYSISSNTLLDNIVLSAKYIVDKDWEAIYQLSEEKLQYNTNSTFYSKLDKNKTTFDYFCFQNFTPSDILIDFKWQVSDLSFKNFTTLFNNNYNGRLTGYTDINDITLTRSPTPGTDESLCIHLDYSLNYNGTVNSLPQFNLKINGEVFLYLDNNYFTYNQAFRNKTFAKRVDKNKTTLTQFCLMTIEDTDTSIEFRWNIKDWKNKEVQKIYYLPGFSTSRNYTLMEVYNKRFDLGSQHFCLSVVFSLKNGTNVNGIALYSRQPRQSWERVFEYISLQHNTIYYQNDNIDPQSKRSNGLCFTVVDAFVIRRQYQWIITSSDTQLKRNFTIKSNHWQIEAPQIFQIETIPFVIHPKNFACFFLKFKIDPHSNLDGVSFGTFDINEINYQEIPGSYQEVFNFNGNDLSYNQNHPLILTVMYGRSDLDQICFISLLVNAKLYTNFKAKIKDFYEQTAEMTYSVPETSSHDLQHNITAIKYDSKVAEVGKPLCITLEYTGQNNHTNLNFFASDPGKVSLHLIYNYSYLNDTSNFCDSKDLDLCGRVDQNKSKTNNICFKSLTFADLYRSFYWNIEDTLGFFSYPFSFDVFAIPNTTPNVTIHSRKYEYKVGDRITAKCTFENMTVNPKLYWYTNYLQRTEGVNYYSHSNFSINNPDWYTSVESYLDVEITSDMIYGVGNLMLTCRGVFGYKGDVDPKRYQTYQSRQLIPIKGVKNTNDTIVNSVLFTPSVYKRDLPVCISVNYTSTTLVFSFSVVQKDGDTIKVIYESDDGKKTFPDKINLTDRIDYKNTNGSTLCLSKVEKNDEREYYWIVNDNKRNHINKPFQLMTYDGPETFDLKIFDIKDFYVVGDHFEGHCAINRIRPEPILSLYYDGKPFQAKWFTNFTSYEKDGFDSVVLFVFQITSEIAKRNMSVISCQYNAGEVSNATEMIIYLNYRDKPQKSSNAGVVAGATVGAILVVALLAGLGYYFYKKRSQDPERMHFISKE